MRSNLDIAQFNNITCGNVVIFHQIDGTNSRHPHFRTIKIATFVKCLYIILECGTRKAEYGQITLLSKWPESKSTTHHFSMKDFIWEKNPYDILRISYHY